MKHLIEAIKKKLDVEIHNIFLFTPEQFEYFKYEQKFYQELNRQILGPWEFN